MNQKMAHRGPDGEGIDVNGDTALLHNRLAIIRVQGVEEQVVQPVGEVVMMRDVPLRAARHVVAADAMGDAADQPAQRGDHARHRRQHQEELELRGLGRHRGAEGALAALDRTRDQHDPTRQLTSLTVRLTDTDHRLAAIVHADIAGFTRMMEGAETRTFRHLKTAQIEVWRPAIDAGGGRLVGTAGDAMLAEFGSAVSAVAAALFQ